MLVDAILRACRFHIRARILPEAALSLAIRELNGIRHYMRTFEKILLFNKIRAYLQRKYEAPRILAHLPFLQGADCIELGCGQGYGAFMIHHYTGCARVIGIDNDPDVVRRARRKLAHPPMWARRMDSTGISFVQDDAADNMFADESFDAAFQFFLLEHVTVWRDALAEVHRILKPGGVYSFEEALVPDWPFLFNGWFGHVPISRDELQQALTDLGFRIERFETTRWTRRCFVLARKAS